MFGATTTCTNNYMSVTIRNVDFQVDGLEIADADEIIEILGTVDSTAQYASIGHTNYRDADDGMTYKFMYSYEAEKQSKAHRKMWFRIKLKYPSVTFSKWGH